MKNLQIERDQGDWERLETPNAKLEVSSFHRMAYFGTGAASKLHTYKSRNLSTRCVRNSLVQ